MRPWSELLIFMHDWFIHETWNWLRHVNFLPLFYQKLHKIGQDFMQYISKMSPLWSSHFGLLWFCLVSGFISLSFHLFPVPRLQVSWCFLFPHLCSFHCLPLTLCFFPFSFFLFFPSLSPGNQTSGLECWVSTFPEKRTIWATQRPIMDPLCSLLPLLWHCTAAHTHAHRSTHCISNNTCTHHFFKSFFFFFYCPFRSYLLSPIVSQSKSFAHYHPIWSGVQAH